jgi:phosphatidylglycerophosphate synthase
VLLLLYDPQSTVRAQLCVALVCAMMATDYWDGRIARRYGITSKTGYLLDGLGDRAFMVAGYLVLFVGSVLGLLMLWLLIFREISQYAVRLLDDAWHSSQSRIDRLSTRAHAALAYVVTLMEVSRPLLFPGPASPSYGLAVSVLLFVSVAVSYSRIVPRLVAGWRRATDA